MRGVIAAELDGWFKSAGMPALSMTLARAIHIPGEPEKGASAIRVGRSVLDAASGAFDAAWAVSRWQQATREGGAARRAAGESSA
jgi:hypothetical protein